jgi:CRISPR-associated protein Cas1
MPPDSDTLGVPECVPARMVNEFVYCPRLAYIEWVQGDFAPNFETVDGQYRHRAVEGEEGRLPAEVEDGDVIHARSVWLSAPTENLTARLDLLEARGKMATPVDYKRGSAPEVPGGVWEADKVQLCAQALVLRANGFACDKGVIYYSTSRTRVEVCFEEELVLRTRAAVQELRRLAEGGSIPAPLSDSPKCPRCSLVPICLPDEVNLLAGAAEGDEDGVRRLLPARDDALPLYVQQQGARVTKAGEVFEVWQKTDRLAEARIFETSQISLFGNVQVTTQALSEAIARDIPVLFFSTGGWFRGAAHGMSHKNAELRIAQFATAASQGASLALAQAFVRTKIENCRTIVRRNHPAAPKELLARLHRLAGSASAATSVEQLLGVEGLAGKLYYQAFPGLLKPRQAESAWTFSFEGRNRRPPTDPVNALLSYAYSLLAKDVTVTVAAVGLDPYVGFYHRPRYGRPALALDLMEEFRPIVADSVVLSVINNGMLTGADFLRRGPAVALESQARRRFIGAYEQRLDTLVTHPLFGYRISYRRVLEVQARLLARHLTRELPAYPPFRTR